MPVRLPFQPSLNNYRMAVPLSGQLFLFDVRWNELASTWSFDLLEEDKTLILGGVKILLNAKLGLGCTHPFFQKFLLDVIALADPRHDAGFDDLGSRVHVVVTDISQGVNT